MFDQSALAMSQICEGAFAYSEFTVFATRTGGPNGSVQAGQNGVAVARFAWIRPDGFALNSRTSPEDVLGLVLPDFTPLTDWRRVFYDEVLGAWKIRQGLNVSLLAAGNMWVRFKGGARVGDQVFANTLDGTAISGNSPSGESTPWFVATAATAGSLAVITTWSKKA